MRALALVIIAAVGLVIFSTTMKPQKEKRVQISPTLKASPAVTVSPGSHTVTLEGKLYSYGIFGPVDNFELTLFTNLPQKSPSVELTKMHSCAALINGGFYAENDTHLGLFQIGDTVISHQTKSPLFDGIVSMTKDGVISITTEIPDGPLSFALQTGPVLISQSQKRDLNIKADEEARRIVALRTSEGQLYFFVFYDESNTFKGPLLAQLPDYVSQVAEQEHISVSDALNLDGGSHSVFKTPELSLPELSPIGSYFCIGSER